MIAAKGLRQEATPAGLAAELSASSTPACDELWFKGECQDRSDCQWRSSDGSCIASVSAAASATTALTASSTEASSSFRPRVSNVYGVNGDVHSAPLFYTWRHIAEPYRATHFDLVSDGDDDGATVASATWTFELLQGVAGQKPEVGEVLSGAPGVTRNFTEAGRMFLVSVEFTTGGGVVDSSNFELVVK